ncbi:MAG TPA: DUF1707 domain-containing protein, partial [Streptosporangiaceae bacterium]|nr:DUF1707 domain-containing protein [Streptosporangiaceae bacterium]
MGTVTPKWGITVAIMTESLDTSRDHDQTAPESDGVATCRRSRRDISSCYRTRLARRNAEDHMATGPDLRIGDAEREAAAASLREHYAQGRLTLEEFNERLDAA